MADAREANRETHENKSPLRVPISTKARPRTAGMSRSAMRSGARIGGSSMAYHPGSDGQIDAPNAYGVAQADMLNDRYRADVVPRCE